jgi:hypothetical protein
MGTVLGMDGGDGCPLGVYQIPCTVYLTIVKIVKFMLCAFYHNKNRKSRIESYDFLAYRTSVASTALRTETKTLSTPYVTHSDPCLPL